MTSSRAGDGPANSSRLLTTTITVMYPAHRGSLGVRGESPLSWERSVKPREIEGNRHRFELQLSEGQLLIFRVIRNEKSWCAEQSYSVMAGESIEVLPSFDGIEGSFEPTQRVSAHPFLDREFSVDIYLPPGYDEHEMLRYPVLYAQDGHALFSISTDLFDGYSWQLDTTLANLYRLHAMQHIIAVGIHTNVDRLSILSPGPDADHGGGAGPQYLQFISSVLKPYIDTNYRTLPDRRNTALIGSSMGGLFSFFASWTRPDVFGLAACLSSSFWWANRSMVRLAREPVCPAPRPWLYLDSGASISPYDRDGNLLDGHHHTVVMYNALIEKCYAPGDDLYCLVFPGLEHNNASWAARVAIPLQLMFPRRQTGTPRLFS